MYCCAKRGARWIAGTVRNARRLPLTASVACYTNSFQQSRWWVELNKSREIRWSTIPRFDTTVHPHLYHICEYKISMIKVSVKSLVNGRYYQNVNKSFCFTSFSSSFYSRFISKIVLSNSYFTLYFLLY